MHPSQGASVRRTHPRPQWLGPHALIVGLGCVAPLACGTSVPPLDPAPRPVTTATCLVTGADSFAGFGSSNTPPDSTPSFLILFQVDPRQPGVDLGPAWVMLSEEWPRIRRFGWTRPSPDTLQVQMAGGAARWTVRFALTESGAHGRGYRSSSGDGDPGAWSLTMDRTVCRGLIGGGTRSIMIDKGHARARREPLPLTRR